MGRGVQIAQGGVLMAIFFFFFRSSSNFPRFSANPNTGLPLATPNQTPLVAENTIHVGGEYPSRLILPVVAMDDLPQVDLKPHIERLLH